MSRAGTLFLIVGPSGAGKDSLIRAAQHRLAGKGFVFPRRWITTGSERGEDHIPVSAADFDHAILRGIIGLNWTAHGLRYGIPRQIEDDLDMGCLVVVNVSRSVLAQARARYRRLRIVNVVVPPALLRLRLVERAREDDAEIEQRLQRSQVYAPTGEDVVAFSNELPLPQSTNLFAEMLIAAQIG
jgi:ribose 1,5-bisphosphokinase